MDKKWWDVHIAEVREVFRGDLASTSGQVRRYGVPEARGWLDPFGNSGAGCVALAVEMGAERVLMLGYDCQKTGGKAHWHGDHPQGLGNAGSVNKWGDHFARLRRRYASKTIINCSRETALTCFPRGDLESELAKDAGR